MQNVDYVNLGIIGIKSNVNVIKLGEAEIKIYL